MDLKYKIGKTNIEVDALSWNFGPESYANPLVRVEAMMLDRIKVKIEKDQVTGC